MRSTPVALLNHLASDATKMAMLVKIMRKDGYLLTLTDHDEDIPYGGDTYKSDYAADLSTLSMTDQLNVNTLDTKGFLDALGISEVEVVSGLWDFAEVRVYRIAWINPLWGVEKRHRGWIGQISTGDIDYIAEIRSLTQKLQSSIIELVSDKCSADVFDDVCGAVPVEGTTRFTNVAVTVVTSPQRRFTIPAATAAVPRFQEGKVIWVSGLNAGLSFEVKTHLTGGDLTLHEATPYNIAVDDTAIVFTGCLKRYQEDCIDIYNNGNRFHGFPFCPGLDALLKGPL